MYSILLLNLLLVTSNLGVPRRQNLNGRIVGGEDAAIENYPYMLSVELDDTGQNTCGAAIVSRNYALTAAKGVSSVPITKIRIRAGSSTLLSGGTLYEVSKMHVHPYFSGGMEYDMALLKVSTPFVYGVAVQPIPLAVHEPSIREIGTVTGWGYTSYKGPKSTQLQVANIPIIDRGWCDYSYQKLDVQITTNMLCAGLYEGGKDACMYDGGGPLVVQGNLAGIISWGYECATATYPGIYTNVVPLRDFIDNTIGVK